MKSKHKQRQHTPVGAHGLPPHSHKSHSVFDDSACGIASHHRCASLEPACSCDAVAGGEHNHHECACGHTHTRASGMVLREVDPSSDSILAGIL